MKAITVSRAAYLLALCIAAASASAQTFQTAVTFTEANGAVPTDVLVQGTDGNLYGTTQYGGKADFGTVFRLSLSGTLTTLYSFCSQSQCVDGSLPDAGLVEGTDGNFYGTTFWGGTQNQGTIFKITPNGSLTTLYSFCPVGFCPDGANPHASLIQAPDDNFYGTTAGGGATNHGEIFRITASGKFTPLYSFCSLANCADGSAPEGALLYANGNLYGTTSTGGGATNGGTVFELTQSGLTTLYSFCSLAKCADGEYPYAGLIRGNDGNFYGTTSGSAPNTLGTIFRITPSGTLTTLYSFCSLANCADGESPYAGLVLGQDGNFYGTTEIGGTNTSKNSCPFGCGTFFQFTSSGKLNTLYDFCSVVTCTDGAQPVVGVVETSGGTFYGTTSNGGTCTARLGGCGTVFAWSPNVVLAPTLTPTSLNFFNQAIDTTSTPKTVAIKNINTGNAILDITSIRLTGSSDFTISSNTCTSTLLAGHSCYVSITFAPTVLGAESATLNIADNAPGSPQTVPISGAGVAQAVVSPTSLTWLGEKVGKTSNPKNLILTNNLPTTLTGISYKTAQPFAVSASTCGTTLASKTNCTISVTFTPTVKGIVTGTLTVTDSANNSPQKVSLTGTGD